MTQEDFEILHKRVEKIECNGCQIGTESQQRLSALESENKEVLSKLKDIKDILANMEKLLIGSISNPDNIGVVAQLRATKEKVDLLKSSFDLLTANYNNLQDEFNKYKWVSRGIITVLSLIGAYAFKIWEFFTKS